MMSHSATPVPHSASARELLRRDTAAAHRAVESLPRMRRMLRPEVSREDYAAVLHGFLPVHAQFEPGVAARAGWEPGTTELRVRALRDDIAALRIDAPQPRVAVAPPHIDDPAAALGACYVLEGSFLGAAVITRHLRARLGESLPLRYFSAHGIDTAGRWQAFLARLEAGLSDEEQRYRALAGARDAYGWLHRVLP